MMVKNLLIQKQLRKETEKNLTEGTSFRGLTIVVQRQLSFQQRCKQYKEAETWFFFVCFVILVTQAVWPRFCLVSLTAGLAIGGAASVGKKVAVDLLRCSAQKVLTHFQRSYAANTGSQVFFSLRYFSTRSNNKALINVRLLTLLHKPHYPKLPSLCIWRCHLLKTLAISYYFLLVSSLQYVTIVVTNKKCHESFGQFELINLISYRM